MDLVFGLTRALITVTRHIAGRIAIVVFALAILAAPLLSPGAPQHTRGETAAEKALGGGSVLATPSLDGDGQILGLAIGKKRSPEGTTGKVASSGQATYTSGTSPAQIIVATYGKSTGDGSLANPLDLRTALGSSSPAGPGTNILLRGGTYRGAYTSTVSGTTSAPIFVSSYPGEWAVLDSGTLKASALSISGNDVWYRDFEVMKSDPDRISNYGTNHPSDVSRAKWSGIWVTGARTKLINLVVHDNGDGIGIWRSAVNSEINGCVLYNNGWLGSDHAWGHGIYAQNDTGTKLIRDNVIFNNFGWGVHEWADYGPIQNITVRGTTSFNNGAPVGKYRQNVLSAAQTGYMNNIVLQDSVMYIRPGIDAINVEIGRPYAAGVTGDHGTATITGNRIIGPTHPLMVKGWSSATITNNTIAGRRTQVNGSSYLAQLWPKTATSPMYSYTWNGNTYRDAGVIGQGPSPIFSITKAGTTRTYLFSPWKSSTGFDTSASYADANPADEVVIRPSAYTPGRAILTVLNTRRAEMVAVDLSKAGVALGQKYKIVDVQNLATPVVTGTYLGGNVSIPMTGTIVTQPIGGAPVPVQHTSSDFGTFLVVPVA